MHKISFENSEFYFRLPFDGYFYTRDSKLLSTEVLEKKGIYEKLVAKINKEISAKNKLKDMPIIISDYILVGKTKPSVDTCKTLMSQLKTNYTHLSISEIIDRMVDMKLADYVYDVIKIKTEKRLIPAQKYVVSKTKDISILNVPKCHSYKLINQLISLDNTLTYEIE